MYEVVKMKFGSHLYGTNTPSSDQDFKGVYMPSRRQFCLCKVEKSIRSDTKEFAHQKNTANDVDNEMYSLPYFVEMACNSDTGALDMLHAPESALLVSSPLWKDLTNNRHKFYSKDLTAFLEYAKKQAGKYAIKGSRLNAVKELIAFLTPHHPRTQLKDLWLELPIGDYSRMVLNAALNDYEYEIVDKKLQKTTRVGYALQILEGFWKKYGRRADQAALNKGVDWKAISHAMRAALQLKELFNEGTITFPLADSSYLIRVKLGEFDYFGDVAPKLEDLICEVKELCVTSDFPDKVDVTYWESWVTSKVVDHISI